MTIQLRNSGIAALIGLLLAAAPAVGHTTLLSATGGTGTPVPLAEAGFVAGTNAALHNLRGHRLDLDRATTTSRLDAIRAEIETYLRANQSSPALTALIVQVEELTARLHQDAGEFEDAAAHLASAFALVDDYFYDEPMVQLRIVRQLGLALRAAGQPAEAELVYRRALALTGGHSGKLAAEHAVNLANYGEFLFDSRRFADAEPLFVQAWRHYRGLENPPAGQFCNAAKMLILAYKGMDEPGRAIRAAGQFEADAKRLFGPLSAPYFEALSAKAQLVAALGDSEMAIRTFAAALNVGDSAGLPEDALGRIEARLTAAYARGESLPAKSGMFRQVQDMMFAP